LVSNEQNVCCGIVEYDECVVGVEEIVDGGRDSFNGGIDGKGSSEFMPESREALQ
jgi:hypothetical protein